MPTTDASAIREIARMLQTSPGAVASVAEAAARINITDREAIESLASRLSHEGLIQPHPSAPRKKAHDEISRPIALTPDGWDLAKQLGIGG